MARSYREHKRRLRGAHMIAPIKVEQGAVLAGRNYLFRYSHGDDVADFCATFRRCPNLGILVWAPTGFIEGTYLLGILPALERRL